LQSIEIVHSLNLLKSVISCAHRTASQFQPGPCRGPSPPATQRSQRWQSQIRYRGLCVCGQKNVTGSYLTMMPSCRNACINGQSSVGIEKVSRRPEENPHSNQEEGTAFRQPIVTICHNLSHLCIATRPVPTEFPPPATCFTSATDDAAAAPPPPPPCGQHAAGIRFTVL